MPKTAIQQTIEKAAALNIGPDGARYTGLSIPAVMRLARTLGISIRQVEQAALETGIVPDRYVRNRQTLSTADQLRLLKAKVCIVGLGGLGGFVTELLARIGVGTLTLVDGDLFEDSNLNRQLLSSENRIGTAKAAVAADRVRAVNSAVAVTACREYLDPANADHRLAGHDLAVDCLDNIQTRFTLENAARRAGIPVVSAAVAGTIGQITAIFPEDPGLRLIYGDPQTLTGPKGAETTLGTPPPIVALVASIEVSQAVKILLGQTNILRNRLLLVDLDENTFETVHLS